MIAETKIAPRLFQWLAIDEATPPRCPELFSAPKFTKPHDPQFFLGLVGLFACGGPAIGFLAAGATSIPEGPAVGAGVLEQSLTCPRSPERFSRIPPERPS